MQHVSIHDMIFIDIETVSVSPDFSALDNSWKELWEEKTKRNLPADVSPGEFYEQRAGVMAEFSKVVCISMGYFLREENLKLRVKSYYNAEEKLLLQEFLQTMNRIEAHSRSWNFVGHNIKEFDIPFICRRLIVNDIAVPSFLDFQNMKPWETNIIDSFQYWRFGDYKNYTSLKLLAATLGIPSPKEDMDGSKVGKTYWQENDIKKIAEYCQRDVLTVANIILKFKNLPLIHQADVDYVSESN